VANCGGLNVEEVFTCISEILSGFVIQGRVVKKLTQRLYAIPQKYSLISEGGVLRHTSCRNGDAVCSRAPDSTAPYCKCCFASIPPPWPVFDL
jgi:hypothetical protein